MEKEFYSPKESLSFVMVIPLHRTDFAIEENFFSTMLAELQAVDPKYCSLKMPKLKVSVERELCDLFEQCQIPLEQLNKFECANRIDHCLHKCSVIINEKGEREKATPVRSNSNPFVVEVTQPFEFFILRRDQILLRGSVKDEAYLVDAKEAVLNSFMLRVSPSYFKTIEERDRFLLHGERIEAHFRTLGEDVQSIRLVAVNRESVGQYQAVIINASRYNVGIDQHKLLINFECALANLAGANLRQLVLGPQNYDIIVLPSSEDEVIHFYQIDSEGQLIYRKFNDCAIMPTQELEAIL